MATKKDKIKNVAKQVGMGALKAVTGAVIDPGAASIAKKVASSAKKSSTSSASSIRGAGTSSIRGAGALAKSAAKKSTTPKQAATKSGITPKRSGTSSMTKRNSGATRTISGTGVSKMKKKLY